VITRNLFAFLFLFGLCFQAQAFDVPRLSGPVIDEVGLLSSSEKSQLEQSLFQFQQAQKIQLQVYITSSLNGEDIASVAIQIFDKWKLGDEKQDTGLLFLIAPNEKRLRIEVGQGLEGVIPDITAKRIIADIVTPYFKQGDFAQGIFEGVSSLQNFTTSGSYEQNLKAAPAQTKKKSSGNGWVFLILIGLWVVIFIISPSTGLSILYMIMASGRGGRGSGGGGGGWSGGGGSSSGGGSSGGW
jgi:uncharacterized protein